MQSYRFGLKYDYLEVNDEIKIQNCDSKEIVALAKVINKRRTIFKKIPIQIDGHEVYRDKEHQREVFSGYYVYIGREIKDEDLFLMIGFELIKQIWIKQKHFSRIIKPKLNRKSYLKTLLKIKGTFGPELEKESKQVRKELEERLEKLTF